MIIDCEKIAKKIINTIKPGGTLAVVRNYNDPSAISYVRQLIKTSRKKDVNIIEEDFGSHSTPEAVNRLIQKHNEDEETHGILLVSPDKTQIECFKTIHPNKNVEGTDADDSIARISCTARACVHIARSVFNDNLEGKKFLVIGYGKMVGKPIAYLLMRMHVSSVVTTHQYTPVKQIFEEHIPQADVIISAVGSPHFIKGTYEGKIFIDAGISILNERVVGDVHPDLAIHNDVTPVPGGVGPVTTALLLQNVSLAAQGLF